MARSATKKFSLVRWCRTRCGTVLDCLWKGVVNTVNHDGIEHAGYLAFLCLLALFPFLVFISALIAFVGEGDIGVRFINELVIYLPERVASGIEERVAEITSGPPQGLLTVAILGAIWTASSAVEGYRTVLNRAFHVGTPPSYLLRRLLSIAQLLIFSFILIISMTSLVVIPVAWERVELWIGRPIFAGEHWTVLIYAFAVLMLFFIVANLYYILPNIKQRMLAVLPGAALCVVMWLLAVEALSFYFSRFDQMNLLYGSLGGIIATLLFFYVINVIFIYGAEFNYLLQKSQGEPMEQKEAAPTQEEEQLAKIK